MPIGQARLIITLYQVLHSIMGVVLSPGAQKSKILTHYQALTHAGKEAVWLHTFISKITGKQVGPLTISRDNQGSLDLVKDNKFHS